MSACCVSGCKSRNSSTSKRFYRIPAGSRPFQANRRRLWLQAIEKVNGSTEGLNGNARICGAHFKSGEASMDHDSPDFVPSVFTYADKKKVKRYSSRIKRQRCTAKTDEEEEQQQIAPHRADSPVDLQSSDLTEEIQTSLSPSEPKEGETWTEEAETESETTPIKSQTTSPSADYPVPDKRIPIVLLKRVFVPAGGYQCEQCNQNFTNAPRLIKHRQVHEEEEEEEEEEEIDSTVICESCGKVFTRQADFTEHQCVLKPSFPCNICDRTFTTSHNLKRHKLLHVKDGRKCHQCGMLFCQRHNHVVFTPLAESVTEYEEDPTEPQNLDAYLMPENHLLEKPEPSQTADLDDHAQSSMTVSPIPPNHKAQSPAPSQASHTKVLPDIPPPVFLILPSVSRLPPPVPRISSKSSTSSWFKTRLPKYPVASIQPPPPPNLQLPPSLKLFSPQYLTSAFLEVNRNYDYILSKPAGVKKKNIVKEEQCKGPWISPHEQSVECVKKERTAYEMEFVL
ncbi:hypothetical protein ABVT39_014837 [Epinephelus coioides]